MDPGLPMCGAAADRGARVRRATLDGTGAPAGNWRPDGGWIGPASSDMLEASGTRW